MVASIGMTIWTFSTLYWTLSAILLLLGGLVVTGTMALVIQIGRHRRDETLIERSQRRIEELLGRARDKGWEAVGEADLPGGRRHRQLMGQTLFERLSKSGGEQRRMASRLYERLGYVRRDCRQAKSRFWQRRLEAMRRLCTVTGFRKRSLLTKGLDDHPRIRLLSARVLTRQGSLDDAIRALNALELTSSLMEQPVYAMLAGVDDERLYAMLASMERIRDSRVRRALIVRAAERDVAGLEDRLTELRESEDVAIRVGVCLAAGQRSDEFGATLLEGLLEDPSWEVRAYAAKSLSTQESEKRLNSLAWALNDPSFWSRDEKEFSSHADIAAIEGELTPTADELCHFHDYLDNAVRWVPHFGADSRGLSRRASATVGGGSP